MQVAPEPVPFGSGSGDDAVSFGLERLGELDFDRGLRLEPERTAARSPIVAVVGAASLVVFWAGLPAILAAGAGVLALNARTMLGRTPTAAIVALILAASTVALAIWFAISG